MKVYLLILLSFITFVSCQKETPESLDCSEYRTGSFEIYDKGLDQTFLIERTETYQTEVTEGEVDTLTMSVNWINDCSYELTDEASGETYVVNFIDISTKGAKSITTSESLEFEYRSVQVKQN